MRIRTKTYRKAHRADAEHRLRKAMTMIDHPFTFDDIVRTAGYRLRDGLISAFYRLRRSGDIVRVNKMVFKYATDGQSFEDLSSGSYEGPRVYDDVEGQKGVDALWAIVDEEQLDPDAMAKRKLIEQAYARGRIIHQLNAKMDQKLIDKSLGTILLDDRLPQRFRFRHFLELAWEKDPSLTKNAITDSFNRLRASGDILPECHGVYTKPYIRNNK